MPIAVHKSLAGGPIDKNLLSGLPREPAFPTAEYHERIARVRDRMRSSNVDVLVVRHPPNVYYLSGFQSLYTHIGECLILPQEGQPVLVVDPPEAGTAFMHSWLDEIHGYRPGVSHEHYLATLLGERRLSGSRVALEWRLSGITAEGFDAFHAALPGADLVDGSELIIKVKTIKSALEIECLRQAATITDAGIRAGIEVAGAGKSDNEVAAAATGAMLQAGSEYMCIAPIVTSGRRSGVLHSTHKRVALEQGDSVCMEFGACYQRYTAPLMRTMSIGDPSPDTARLSDGCLSALANVLDTMRPGVTAHEVARAGWKGIERAGPDLVFHGCFAYGVGAGFPPAWGDGTTRILLDDHTPLEPGMVFHHPIALRQLGECGAMFSETTVITGDGCEALGKTPRELQIR